jgi:ubiquitin-like 1-activating enzyme E1 A
LNAFCQISQTFSWFRLVVNGWGHELSPVCAVGGGLLAQEVLKAVSGKDAPLQNVVLFNGIMSEAGVQNLRP